MVAYLAMAREMPGRRPCRGAPDAPRSRLRTSASAAPPVAVPSTQTSATITETGRVALTLMKMIVTLQRF